MFYINGGYLKNPEIGLWKPEYLKYFNKNLWPRKVNQEHRIVYLIDYNDKEIKFLSFRFHYDYLEN